MYVLPEPSALMPPYDSKNDIEKIHIIRCQQILRRLNTDDMEGIQKNVRYIKKMLLRNDTEAIHVNNPVFSTFDNYFNVVRTEKEPIRNLLLHGINCVSGLIKESNEKTVSADNQKTIITVTINAMVMLCDSLTRETPYE